MMKITQQMPLKFASMGILYAMMFCFIFFTSCRAQKTDPQQRYFVALYTTGETWDTKKSPADQPYFKEHSAHLNELRKDSVIVIGARYSDTGMIILKAKNQVEAETLLLGDLAIKNKLFQVEIHPLQPFYKGRLE